MPFPAFVALAFIIGIITIVLAWRLQDRVYAVTAAIAGATAVMFINAIFYVRHYADDSYITLRYSRNLADGVGPVWNPGQRVEGYTDFLWMAVLAGMNRIGMDLVSASLLLSYASMLAMMLIVWRIWRIWSEEQPESAFANPAVLAAALLAIGLNDAVVFWGFSGLETPLASTLLTALLWAWMVESRRRSFPWSALIAVAAAMTRPELLFMAGVAFAFTAYDAWTERDARNTRRLLLWGAMFAVLYGAYFAWRFGYYGYFFPNTYYAKVGSNIDFISRGLTYVRMNGASYLFLPFLLGAAVLLFGVAARLRRDAAFIVVALAVWVAAVIVEGGDAFQHGRFLTPVVPVLYLAGVCGIATMLQASLPDRRRYAWVAGAALALAGLALAHASIDPTLQTDRRALQEREILGRWINANTPQDYTIAVFAAGATPYYAQRRALDMLGLTDETIAHTKVPAFGRGLPAHEKFNIDYALDTVRPEIIVMGDSSPSTATKAQYQGSLGLVAGLNALVLDPRTYERYEPAAIRVPGYADQWFNLLVRKDVVASLNLDWTESKGILRGPRVDN
ncbi:MAG: hypothetical protein HYX50_05550 [Chloroflexi bacterium]|nr:hypothetical protein [Chloroflexota bacterium]